MRSLVPPNTSLSSLATIQASGGYAPKQRSMSSHQVIFSPHVLIIILFALSLTHLLMMLYFLLLL